MVIRGLSALKTTAAAGVAAGLALSGCSSSSRHTASSSTTTTAPATTTTTTSPPTTTSSTTVAVPLGGPVPGGFQPESVTFDSPSEGWVLGTAPCPAGTCTTLVRTEDGGQTWSAIPAPSASVGQGAGRIDKLRFADRLDGWAYGHNALYVTHDGGGHWTAAPLPEPGGSSILSLEAGGGYAYALMLAGSGAAPATAAVYRTAVNSNGWSLQPGTSVPGAVAGHLVVEAGRAWMVVEVPNGPSSFRADLSGQWVTHSLPCQQPGAGVLAAANTQDLTVVCAEGAAAGSEPKLPYLSTDAGASWHAASQAPPAGDTMGAAMAGPGTIVISAASGASFLYASFDGGHTWSTVLQDSASGGQPWFDLGFTTPQQGVVVEGTVGSPGTGGLPPSRLLMTRDGGHSWSPVAF